MYISHIGAVQGGVSIGALGLTPSGGVAVILATTSCKRMNKPNSQAKFHPGKPTCATENVCEMSNANTKIPYTEREGRRVLGASLVHARQS